MSKHSSVRRDLCGPVRNIMLLIDIGKDCMTASFTWIGPAKCVVWDSELERLERDASI
jgi:hypothetical protein